MTPLEVQIENAWSALTESVRPRRFYLTADGHLRHGEGAGIEVGTFTRTVQLIDFREAVYCAHAEANHG